MELKYKVGDKVLVEVVVTNTDEEDSRFPYEVETEDGVVFWISTEYLHESVSENKSPTTWNNVEVGDIVNILGNVSYTVKTLAEDRVFVRAAVGYILHTDIDAIYKKSWEKPKDLQDMSKEELIELVKKLKGE